MGKANKDELADALAAMSQTSGPTASDAVNPAGIEPAATAPKPDDVMLAPPPDASVFAPRRSTANLLAEQRLRAQRTAIPILLTCGVMLPIVGSLKWLAGEDSVFARWSVAL